MKPIWLAELERGIEALEQEVEKKREVAPTDPVADGIHYAVREIRARLVVVTDPTAERSPAQFAAEQVPKVSEQIVRIWIKNGELPARRTEKGWRIPASAVRTKKATVAA